MTQEDHNFDFSAALKAIQEGILTPPNQKSVPVLERSEVVLKKWTLL